MGLRQTPPRLTPPALGLLVAALAACGGAAPSAERVEVRDSAGVVIVENGAPDPAILEEWALSEPQVKIGTLEGEAEYQLFRVVNAVRTSDARIVIGNSGTHELRIYDSDGRFVHASGGEGQGPGEFKNFGWMRIAADDSLLVWDWGTARLSIFDSEGRFARSVRFESPSLEGFPQPVGGRFSGGGFLVRSGTGYTLDSPAGVQRDTGSYYRFGPDGNLVEEVGRFPSNDVFVYKTDRFLRVSSLPFGKITQAGVTGDEFFIGTADAFEIRFYGLAGDLSRIVRVPHSPRPVTRADIEGFKRDRLERAEAGRRDEMEDWLEQLQFPELKPSYRAIVPDREHNLWVAGYPEDDGETTRWLILDRQGKLVASMRTMSKVRLLDIGSDYALTHARDELDVEYVRLHGLLKGTGS